MKWITSKATQVEDGDLYIEATRVDGHVKSLDIQHGETRLRVTADYGMNLVVPAPPTTEEKFVLFGSVLGVKVEETFDSRWDAEQRLRALESGVREDVTLTVESRQIVVDE